ncbi:MAG: hypothetical protein FJ348_04465 [Sphingomonadales bacterium]|nr:hypothetical protein [Sphingomonadales bacterium]
MKLRILFGVMISFVLSLLSCQAPGTPNMLTELSACDSAVVMYYKTPGNPRFFQMVKVYKPELLTSLAANANQPALAGLNECTSEGKIYYYGYRGEVLVLYFTVADSCKRLSFIKTGEKYGVKLSPRNATILDSLKSFSYEPVGTR